MDSTALSSLSISEDGEYAAQLNGKDLTIHLNPTLPEFQDVNIVKVKESASKFLKFSRPNSPSSVLSNKDDTVSDRRILWASDTRILVWQLNPLQLHAEIESVEPGATNIDFGGDQNEIIVFHAWNTKLTVFGMDTGRSQVVKTPKFSHSNGFGYRPNKRQFAILLKPDAADLLTIHEFRSYALIGRAVLPTVDAQGLKWSPDGRWIAVWDAASTGTKVLIFTADGQLFRTYTGLPDSDPVFDLGVKGVEWSPLDGRTGKSELLAVAMVDGNVDLLKTNTVSVPDDSLTRLTNQFTCSVSLSHMFNIDNSPSIWRERCIDGRIEYAEASGSSAFSTTEASGPPRGLSIMTFSPDASLLATVDQTRPNIVWIWTLKSRPNLISALVNEHAVRQIIWHLSNTELLLTTANNVVAAVRYWAPDCEPKIIQIPIPQSETGRYDIRWVVSDQSDHSKFWFGTSEDYAVGSLSAEDGIPHFEVVNSLSTKTL